MNIQYKLENNKIIANGTYIGLLKDIEVQRNKSFKNNGNANAFKEYTTNEDSHHLQFSGGTWEDVTNLNNMSAFKKQLEEFKKNKLEEKIVSKLDFKAQRKRSLSEHDGDYDYDKRWEIKPFSNSRKEMLPISVVDIIVDMSISCAMDAVSINKYGTLVWSIVQLVESIGIQASIKIVNESTQLSTDGKEAKLSLEIKKAGEYISPVALASCFQSVFYRRVIFAGMVLECEMLGLEATYNLGSPKVKKTDKFVWFENGAIYTRAGGSFNAKEIEDSILAIVQSGKK